MHEIAQVPTISASASYQRLYLLVAHRLTPATFVLEIFLASVGQQRPTASFTGSDYKSLLSPRYSVPVTTNDQV